MGRKIWNKITYQDEKKSTKNTDFLTILFLNFFQVPHFNQFWRSFENCIDVKYTTFNWENKIKLVVLRCYLDLPVIILFKQRNIKMKDKKWKFSQNGKVWYSNLEKHRPKAFAPLRIKRNTCTWAALNIHVSTLSLCPSAVRFISRMSYCDPILKNKSFKIAKFFTHPSFGVTKYKVYVYFGLVPEHALK